jgi:thiol-disulfide isomerase/thioredoxin
VLALVAFTLTSCTSSVGSREAGYVEGPGTLSHLTPAQRGAPVDFSGTPLDGRQFTLSSTRGHVTVLNVWASWCPPCRAEAPGLVRAAEALAGQGVRFVGVNTRDQPAQARAYVRRFGLPFPSVVDDGGAVMLTFRDTLPPTAIPSTLVLDSSGRIAARVVGGVTETRIREVVAQVLAEEPARTGAPR